MPQLAQFFVTITAFLMTLAGGWHFIKAMRDYSSNHSYVAASMVIMIFGILMMCQVAWGIKP